MKQFRPYWTDASHVSHPVRGAWIETVMSGDETYKKARRTPYGVRGLKLP